MCVYILHNTNQPCNNYPCKIYKNVLTVHPPPLPPPFRKIKKKFSPRTKTEKKKNWLGALNWRAKQKREPPWQKPSKARARASFIRAQFEASIWLRRLSQAAMLDPPVSRPVSRPWWIGRIRRLTLSKPTLRLRNNGFALMICSSWLPTTPSPERVGSGSTKRLNGTGSWFFRRALRKNFSANIN